MTNDITEHVGRLRAVAEGLRDPGCLRFQRDREHQAEWLEQAAHALETQEREIWEKAAKVASDYRQAMDDQHRTQRRIAADDIERALRSQP